jgi:subtilisin family serine protease
VRPLLFLLFVAAVLACSLPAAAALQPIRRSGSELTLPRVRPGTIRIPVGHAQGRVRVIARLALPPLAARFGRRLAAAGAIRRLDVASAASRAYLARLGAAQTRAVRMLRQAIPQVRIGRRFRVVLDGITVSIPVHRLPRLLRLGFVTRVYPSIAYTEQLDRSPSVIGADEIERITHADGAGIKIGVVDDGVDQSNPFFDPSGYSYPAGFPKGGRKWTTPKVIVAKVFPGPHSGRRGRLGVDPDASFHGTHVAGIAAGDSQTTAPAGRDHPRTTGLSGVAPRAWIGNYRVFTVPTPIGHVANTPEIVAAFEAAVADGMDVINFSGGSAEIDPSSDALVEAVRNVAAAGVVPVIAAGNDRDQFGLGTTGTPATAPDAIAVAAVSSSHVFSPALTVTASGAGELLRRIPFLGAGGTFAPPSWGATNQRLVDVGSIVGRDGRRVERHLCGGSADLAAPAGQLPAHSLDGAIALAARGLCPFTTKTAQARAAGAIGLVLSDDREGEANEIPLRLSLPAGTVSNLDGERLRAFMAESGGRTTVRVGRSVLENVTGRSTGVVTSFSSAGPTAFAHALKPDVAAPGGQILSSTLPSTDPSRFAVFDGTSMATPHVAGAAALLLQLHPAWTLGEIKSALVSTAGPAWGDTAQTEEAPVLLEGGGLVYLPRAADPLVFTDPASLSFGNLEVANAAASKQLLARIADAGGGDGTWSVGVLPQSATPGTSIDVSGSAVVPPGGEADVSVVVRAAPGAPSGEDYGFVVLRRGDVTRRVPYLFVVERPALALAQPKELQAVQRGDTRGGASRVGAYRYPVSPFGISPETPPMREDGAEQLYVLHLRRPALNLGVSVEAESKGARIDPFVLGARDESEVQGYAGTPADVNELTYDFGRPVGAAGASMPRPRDYYVAVDSGRNSFTNRSLAGTYTLREWIDDVDPPTVRILTTRVAAGRPVLAVRTVDRGAGVDPLSLAISYQGAIVGASAYDPVSGLALFPLSRRAPALRAGRTRAEIQSSDFQEAKNVDTFGSNILPNTRFETTSLRVVDGPALTWLAPAAGGRACGTTSLVVAASSPGRLRNVRFADGTRTIGVDRTTRSGLASVRWRARAAESGPHVLTATATDSAGRVATERNVVRVCP